jgi:hypothetical protein
MTPDAKFLVFLEGQKSAARLDFLEARKQLRDFHEEWGSWPNHPELERQDNRLTQALHLAYLAYRKAWTEWYAAINGFSLHRTRNRKQTEAFATPVPVHEILSAFEDRLLED